MRVDARRTLAAVSLTALLAAACDAPTTVPAEDPVEAPEQELVESPPQESGEATDDPALANECHNDVDGYRIRFPDGWHTNDGSVTAPCQVFGTEPPDVEPATEFPFDGTILLDVIDRPFDEVDDMIASDPSIDVGHLEHTTIGGRDAVRVDGTSTGEGLLDAGVGVHLTFVAFDGRILLASAHGFGEPGLDERRRVVARMLETLSEDPPDGP